KRQWGAPPCRGRGDTQASSSPCRPAPGVHDSATLGTDRPRTRGLAMVLRDKRVWGGVLLAVVLAFVSYSVVSRLVQRTRDHGNVAHPITDSPAASAPPPAPEPGRDLSRPRVD